MKSKSRSNVNDATIVAIILKTIATNEVPQTNDLIPKKLRIHETI
jgi:hypothetical protein